MAYIRCYALSIGIATKTYVSEQIVAFGYIPEIYTTLPIAYFRKILASYALYGKIPFNSRD